jgi:hypothetical protein
MICRFYGRKKEASLDNLLLESFGSGAFYFQYLSKANESVEKRVRGQNNKRVSRQRRDINESRRGESDATTRMHISPRETHAWLLAWRHEV